ncbi:TIGR00266 family protein [Paenibacillus sp. GSMTC-2017]|uniref:TIGR00266 family protein n=1 Tax=Paenibacillus sp. GSMTC-2017 TaxID=2794350 RepID=UPI0018D5C82E|nr:TIGR00266 family protein [Paenibacillus sp. GSMTC-2017]MBH5318895.1 TIGR00266 family protein [Paenibacillus sp. GSMTC-2017]
MKYEVLNKGAFAMLSLKLSQGDRIKAESGAMVSMSPSLDLKGTTEGGIMKGLGRLLSGESFFFQEVNASMGDGELVLAPRSLGDVQAIELDGSQTLLVQKDGFLAATDGIEISTKMQNLSKGIFSGEGFFIVEISGRGTVFLSSFGAIHEVKLAPGEEIVIDNGHLVAWPKTMQYSIEKSSKGWVSSLKSGEMLVCRFKGEGVILVQSRNPGSFGNWLRRYIPTTSS